MDIDLQDQIYYQENASQDEFSDLDGLGFGSSDFMFGEPRAYPTMSRAITTRESSIAAHQPAPSISPTNTVSPTDIANTNNFVSKESSSTTGKWTESQETLVQRLMATTDPGEFSSIISQHHFKESDLTSLLSPPSNHNDDDDDNTHINFPVVDSPPIPITGSSKNHELYSSQTQTQTQTQTFSTAGTLINDMATGENQMHFGNVDDLSIDYADVSLKEAQATNNDAKAAVRVAMRGAAANTRRTRRRNGAVPNTTSRRKVNNDLKQIDYILADENCTKPHYNYSPLSDQQIWNGITMEHVKYLNTDPSCFFESNPKFNVKNLNLYEPAVNKKAIVGDSTRDSNKSRPSTSRHRSSEGNWSLCPLCPVRTDSLEGMKKDIERNLFRRNDSNYLHHMIQFHGIFSNGDLVEEPIYRGWASCEEEKTPVEVIQCTYCDELIKLKKIPNSGEKRNRFLKFLRHVKDRHYSGKNMI